MSNNEFSEMLKMHNIPFKSIQIWGLSKFQIKQTNSLIRRTDSQTLSTSV